MCHRGSTKAKLTYALCPRCNKRSGGLDKSVLRLSKCNPGKKKKGGAGGLKIWFWGRMKENKPRTTTKPVSKHAFPLNKCSAPLMWAAHHSLQICLSSLKCLHWTARNTNSLQLMGWGEEKKKKIYIAWTNWTNDHAQHLFPQLFPEMTEAGPHYRNLQSVPCFSSSSHSTWIRFFFFNFRMLTEKMRKPYCHQWFPAPHYRVLF